MTHEELFQAALHLPSGERELLAEKLLESLPEESESDMDDELRAAWSAELAARAADFDNGRETVVPWSEARDGLLREMQDEA